MISASHSTYARRSGWGQRARQRAYLAPRSSFDAAAGPLLRPAAKPVPGFCTPQTDWPQLWRQTQTELRKARFHTSTLRVYRQVLRSFRDFVQVASKGFPAAGRPADVSAPAVQNYLGELADRHSSASWLSTNISVLRTVFDKFAGRALTGTMRTPKRPQRMPDTLCGADSARLLAAAPNLRDRLLIGLLGECGMKIGELLRLTWGDVDVGARTLAIRYAGDTRTRRLTVPQSWIELLALGQAHCDPAAPVFAGARRGKPLTARMAERIVRHAALEAGIPKDVNCLTLRHSFAVGRLRAGASVREVQEALGHKRLRTTMLYYRYLACDTVISPADKLFKQCESPGAGAATRDPQPVPPRQAERAARAHESASCKPPAEMNPTMILRLARNAVEFYAALKARFSDRFLAARRHKASAPPPNTT